MRPIGYDRPPPGGRNTPCLAIRRGCASRRRSSWRKVRALLVHRAGAVGCVVAAVRLDHASLVVRGLRPYLLRKDSGLVRLARQTGGRGEGRKPSLSALFGPWPVGSPAALKICQTQTFRQLAS